MKYLNPNVLNEGNEMELLQYSDNEMLTIVRCNNCGKLTPFGFTRMCSGFVGCDNQIEVNGKMVSCYFDDLMPRVRLYHNSEEGTAWRKLYREGKVYRWRDGVF